MLHYCSLRSFHSNATQRMICSVTALVGKTLLVDVLHVYSGAIGCLFFFFLHPWLVPSSGVAGIADDLIPPFCPVCCVVFFVPGLSRHLGSPI